MACGKRAIFICIGTALFARFLMCAPKDPKIIPAESGQTVTLPCRAPNSVLVEWTRLYLKPEYVFVYRNGKFDPANQHPSFKNRVDLQDRQMKDGDVSLILKNVTTAYSGKYECRVLMEETSSPELISTIYLRVAPPGQPGGQSGHEGKERNSVGLKVGPQFLLYCCCFLLLVLLVF